MKSFLRFVLVMAILAGIAYGTYSWLLSRKPENLSALSVPQTPPASVQPSATPSIHYPVPTESAVSSPSTSGARQQLPASVDQSDPSIMGALIGLFGRESFDALFRPKDIIRRIVVTIDNATARKEPSEDMWPLKAPEPGFLASGKGAELSISPRNARRYQPYADLIKRVDVANLARVYRRFYPLFQSAYRDLGTKGYFNDRLVAVIDRLLQTPDLVGSVKLVRGINGRYRFADPAAESLTCGQKLLIRMGFENERMIKSKLRKLRAFVTFSHGRD